MSSGDKIGLDQRHFSFVPLPVQSSIHFIIKESQCTDFLTGKTHPDADFRGKVRLTQNHVVTKIHSYLGDVKPIADR